MSTSALAIQIATQRREADQARVTERTPPANDVAVRTPRQPRRRSWARTRTEAETQDFDRSIAFYQAEADYAACLASFVKSRLGLEAYGSGVCLALGPGLEDLARRAAAAADIHAPVKPDGIQDFPSVTGPVAGQSPEGGRLLSLFFPTRNGGGSVELWLDGGALVPNDTLSLTLHSKDRPDLLRSDLADRLLAGLLELVRADG